MEIAQLKTVREVYNAGSVSRASMRLNKAPSILSRQINSFERECGGRIFLRTGRGVELTELGEKIIPQIDQIIEAMDHLAGSGKDDANALSGEVRLLVSSVLSRSFVARLFAEVRDAYPGIRLQIDEAYSVAVDMGLENDQADVGVFLRNGRSVGANDEPICQFDTYLVGAPGDPILARHEMHLSELEGLPLFLPSEPCLARYAVADLAASRGFTLSIAAEVNSGTWNRALIESGAGYAIVPIGCGAAIGLGSLGPEVQEGRFDAARILDAELKRTLVVAANGGKKERIEVVRNLAIKILRDMMHDLEGNDTRLYGT